VNNKINWKVKTYTQFSNIIYIEQDYKPDSRIRGMDFAARKFHAPYYITLEKTERNKIKVTIKDIVKINGSSVKNREYFVKTDLSLKKHYLSVFKPEMIKLFS